MRKLLTVALGLFFSSALVLAQTHSRQPEKVVKAEINFAADTRVGTHVLKAGDYKVICDGKTMTFTRIENGKDVEKVMEVRCNGRVLPKPAEQTVTSTDVDKSGSRYVKTLLLKGSNVEHTFD